MESDLVCPHCESPLPTREPDMVWCWSCGKELPEELREQLQEAVAE